MSSLNSLDNSVIVIIIILYFISNLLQTFKTLIISHQLPKNRPQVLLNCLMIVQLLFLTLTLVQFNYYTTTIHPYFYYLNAIILCLSLFNNNYFLAIYCLCHTLTMSSITQSLYPYLFFFCAISYFLSFVIELPTLLYQLNTTVSNFSIKEALDTLPSGVIFSINDKIILINKSMTHLLKQINVPFTIQLSVIFDYLTINNTSIVDVIPNENTLLLRLKNEQSWLLVQDRFDLNDKTVTQILVTNVSNAYHLSQAIIVSNNELEKTTESLLTTIKNLESIEKNKEIIRLKSRVHDIIGQRLSIIHRLLEDNSSAITVTHLKKMLKEIKRDLEQETNVSPLTILQDVIKSFSFIDVSIIIDGQLPSSVIIARCFVQVIREASTNAVRHVKARTIYVTISREKELRITNDGLPLEGDFIEGNGIKGMRNRVENIGGTLMITPTPTFMVSVLME